MKTLHVYKIIYDHYGLVSGDIYFPTPKSLWLVAYTKAEAIKKMKDWWTIYRKLNIDHISIMKVEALGKYKHMATEERYNKENKLIYG